MGLPSPGSYRLALLAHRPISVADQRGPVIRSRRHKLAVIAVIALTLLAGCSGAVGTDSPAATDPGTGSGDSSTTGTLTVHFINVGQSDAILVEGPNQTLLMDTGDFTNDGELVLEYLQAQDIQRLDYLVSSHADADHIGGHAAVIEYFETQGEGVGAIYDPGIAASTQTYERYLDAVERYNVTLYEAQAGDEIPFDGARIDVLGPPRPYLENGDRNENSIVLKLTHGQTSVLLPGDAEATQEADLVDRYGDQLNATILRAAHHGSQSSSTEPFLDAVDPQAVVITSAYDSQYGHPDEVVLERLADRALPTYWTATHGTTVLESNGSAITVKTQRAAPTDPLALRDGEPVEPGTEGPVSVRATIDGQQVTTPVVTDGGMTPTTTDGDGTLELAAVNADAEGDDRENLNDEYLVFTNTGDAPLDLSGWTVRDAAGATYTFPDGVTLGPGDRLTLHTGSGTDTETDLYWGSGSPIWNNGGDTVRVTNSQGEEVLSETYE